MSMGLSSQVPHSSNGYAAGSDGLHSSCLTTSSPPQPESDANLQSFLSSITLDAVTEPFRKPCNSDSMEYEACPSSGTYRGDTKGYSRAPQNPKPSDNRTRGEDSVGSSGRVGAIPTTTVDAVGGVWGRGIPSSLLPSCTGVNLEGLAGLPSATMSMDQTPSLPLITTNDYSDRQRLLYHLTYLHTQLQRAFLQIQEQQRILTILHASAAISPSKIDPQIADSPTKSRGHFSGSSDPKSEVEEEEEEVVMVRIAASCTAAVVAASRTDEAIHAALRDSLARFDPLIAQSQIQRLDDALAHLSLLREAELQQLQRGEEERKELRTTRNDLVERVDSLQSSCERLKIDNEGLRSSLASASLEVERLRQEELHLSRRLVSMEEFMRTGNLYDGVRIVDGGGGPYPPSQPRGGGGAGVKAKLDLEKGTNRSDRDIHIQRLNALAEEETAARQALLQDLFWEPMLIAFDAGLTWTEEFLMLTREGDGLTSGKSGPRDLGNDAFMGVEVAAQTHDRDALDELAAVMRAPATDADLLLIRNQQNEIQQLQREVGMLKERQRMADFEVERLSGLYVTEQRHSENLARDHSAQLQQAYQELVKDRQMIAQQLRKEVEEQVRMAFYDGRQYERQHPGDLSVTESSMPSCLRDVEKAQESRNLSGKPPLTRG
ncbi:unnamed protein product [Phytomonas sp. Hart1]|nr:unnamed protein product [Phytomonas sp. Hart1]|eukprot:CCW65940.1 unnamed protein product [Phytomonas sp. isolate Hart1]